MKRENASKFLSNFFIVFMFSNHIESYLLFIDFIIVCTWTGFRRLWCTNYWICAVSSGQCHVPFSPVLDTVLEIFLTNICTNISAISTMWKVCLVIFNF